MLTTISTNMTPLGGYHISSSKQVFRNIRRLADDNNKEENYSNDENAYDEEREAIDAAEKVNSIYAENNYQEEDQLNDKEEGCLDDNEEDNSSNDENDDEEKDDLNYEQQTILMTINITTATMMKKTIDILTKKTIGMTKKNRP